MRARLNMLNAGPVLLERTHQSASWFTPSRNFGLFAQCSRHDPPAERRGVFPAFG
jgi:hypothetical protein